MYGSSLPVIVPAALLDGAFFAFRQSNAVGKAIVFLLLAGSVIVWTIMITKSRELRDARLQSERFLRAYREASHPIVLFHSAPPHGDSEGPLRDLYVLACRTLGAALETDHAPRDCFEAGQRFDITAGQVSAVRNAIERAVADQALALESNMGLLANAASTAPFLGLLGTVCGVMEAFGAMSTGGTAMLSDVAPGISGALLTTVVGLLVALPSAFGYNMLSTSVRRLVVQLDNFAQELSADLEQLRREG